MQPKPQMNYHDEVSEDEGDSKEGGFQESMSIEATNKVKKNMLLNIPQSKNNYELFCSKYFIG